MDMRSERLRLSPMADGDLDHVYAGLSHPDVVRHYGVRYSSRDATREQLAWYAAIVRDGTGIWWSIRSLANGAFLGAIGLDHIVQRHRRGEIGFWLLPAHWGQGYVSEALPLVIDHAFRARGLHRLMGEVETDNAASARVLSRAGFVHEGTLRECELKDGRLVSLDIFALLSSDPR